MTDRKLNLLILVAGLNIGGAEVVIQHLVHAIDRRRFSVTVCCIKTIGVIGEDLLRQGVDVVTLAEPGALKVDYLTFIKLRRLIRQRRIDIVHSHSTDALADAAVCRLLMPRLKVVHTFHFGNYPHVTKRKLRIEGLAWRFASRLVAVGNVQRQQIQSTYRINDAAIDTVWNGVPSSCVSSEGSFRRLIGGTDRILIGTIATLIPQKGLTDLLLVAQRVRKINSKVLFVVLGEGGLRGELEAMRSRLELEDTVVFAGWVKDAAKTALPDFDVFFQPSIWEAMSIAVLEAMAAGRAVLATRVGENSEIIDHESNGLLVEPRDIEGMTDCLVRLINDSLLRERLGRAAAQTVADRFTVHGMARAYEKMYLECVGVPAH